MSRFKGEIVDVDRNATGIEWQQNVMVYLSRDKAEIVHTALKELYNNEKNVTLLIGQEEHANYVDKIKQLEKLFSKNLKEIFTDEEEE